VIASLFAQLGDPARALAWWERVSQSSPDHPPFQFALGDAVAAAGDPARAKVHFVAAAAGSGDAGAFNLAATRSLMRHGASVDALDACRRALHHAAPGQDHEVLELLVAINSALGRTADADAARERLVERTPPRFRDAARGVWQSRHARSLGETEGGARHPEDVPLAIARARTLAAAGKSGSARALLEVAIAWNPHNVDARIALLGHLEGSGAHLATAAVELLAVAANARRPARRRAFEALVPVFETLGAPAAAEAARGELRALARMPASPAGAWSR
jgi:hypothetical protein